MPGSSSNKLQLSLDYRADAPHLAFSENLLLDNNFTKAWPDIAFDGTRQAQISQAVYQPTQRNAAQKVPEQRQKANET